jgi:hypothetical protein
VLEVLAQRPVDGELAQTGLPEMAVRVDQPRHHDPVGGVHDLRRLHRKRLADGDDTVVFDEHVAPRQITDVRVDAEDDAAAHKGPGGHGSITIRRRCTWTR